MKSTIDAAKIKGRIVELGYTQAEVADKLNLSATAFNNKLTGKTEFVASEIAKLSIILSISKKDEYFFALKVE